MSEAEKIVTKLLENDPDNIDPQEYAFQAKDEQDQKIAALKAAGQITPEIVPHLRQGQTIWHRTVKRADGSAAGVRITSIKLWKTRPGEYRIGWKYGMYEHGTIEPRNAADWTLVEPPPGPKPVRRR